MMSDGWMLIGRQEKHRPRWHHRTPATTSADSCMLNADTNSAEAASGSSCYPASHARRDDQAIWVGNLPAAMAHWQSYCPEYWVGG